MTEFPVLFVLNALWVVGLLDAWVRGNLSEQVLPEQTKAAIRGVAALVGAVLVYLVLAAWLPAPDDAAVPVAAAERIRWFLFKLGAIGCVVVGLDALMRHVLKLEDNLTGRQTLVNGLVGFAVLFVFPLQDNLRLGIDLAGGTQLTYTVEFFEDSVPAQKIDAVDRVSAQVIETLGGPLDARGEDVESTLKILAETLAKAKVLDAAQAEALAEQAAALKAVPPADRFERAAGLEKWVQSARDLVAARITETDREKKTPAAKAAKELDELASNLSRMEALPVNKDKAVEDLIATLQKRVDPGAVLGLIWSYEGDKLTIQMPAPKDDIARLRGEWYKLREEVDRGNVAVPELLQAVKSAAAGDKAAAARLEDLKTARKDRAAQIERLEAAAKARLLAPSEPARQKAFDEAVAAVEAGNVPVQVLEEALRLPKDQRPKAVAELKKAHPARAEQIAAAAAAYADYRDRVQSAVEDVEDLKRELRGAGVLSFHILPTQDELPEAARRAAEEQLEKYGRIKPVRTTDPATESLGNFKWFLADDPDFARNHQVFPQLTAQPLRNHRYILAWDADPAGKRMTLKSGPREPWKLERVMPTRNENGAPAVHFEFDELGGQYFRELTKANTGRAMMIVIDERAITAPRINAVIGKKGIIEGKFTDREVESLVRKLNAGSLRARLGETPISEQTIGSTLGADNQRKGLNASVWSLIVVAAFIAGYYRVGGLVANLALVFNLILLLGAMVFLNAAMTLPAIAGLVLTLGMAVDANILIFERLREEREHGVALRQAIRNAYDRAWSAILDSNLTTIISCLILVWVGSGDVKSFGLTLLLGVSISMFTALFATRTIFDILASKGWLTDVKFFNAIGKPKVDWMGLLPIFLTVSAVLNLWATDMFFGLPVWAAALLAPAAAALVGVVMYRNHVGTWWGYAAAGLAVTPTALPFLARLGLFDGSWDAAMQTFGAVAAVAGLGLIGWLYSQISSKPAAAATAAEDFRGAKRIWEKASYAAITLAGLAIAAGFGRVMTVGAPAENFDIEFSTGTAVQVAFRPTVDKEIEQVRSDIRDLGRALETAEVAGISADTYEIKAPGLTTMTGVRFPRERFGDRDAVQAYVRGKGAEKLGGSYVQALAVAETDDAGNPVTRDHFQIKTLEDNLDFVDAALRAKFADGLDVQEAVRGPGQPLVAVPVPPVADRGLTADSPNAPFYAEFEGGVLLRMGEGPTAWKFEVPQRLEDIEKRIAREVNRGGNTDNVVTVFKVVPGEPGEKPGTYRTVEILGRGPAGTPRPPTDGRTESPEYRSWERTVAAPFAKLAEGSLSNRQAFGRIVNFNPQVAERATREALSAVFLSWLAIVAYMWFRFGEARWGVAGVVCLVHDVCVALGALLAAQFFAGTAIGDALGLEAFKIDLTAVAAVLTIIGYSINDTIVVFDRIREVRGRAPNLTAGLINDSINQTMSRTLLTAFVTWLSVGVLYAFGGAGIHVFSFLMLVGILVGCYSSIAIAAPILLLGTAGFRVGGTAPAKLEKPAAEPRPATVA